MQALFYNACDNLIRKFTIISFAPAAAKSEVLKESTSNNVSFEKKYVTMFFATNIDFLGALFCEFHLVGICFIKGG